MRSALHLATSMIGAVALAVALLVIIGVCAVASGAPSSLIGAMNSKSEAGIDDAIGEAKIVLWGLHAVAYPLVAGVLGGFCGKRERGARALAAVGVGLIPLVSVVLFVGAMRAWALGLAIAYLALGMAMSRVAQPRNAS